MKRLKAYWSSRDDRGVFTGITQSMWAEVNIVETRASEYRGDHYHKETTEILYVVSGRIDVHVRHVDTGIEHKFVAKKGDIFLIEPFELHAVHTRTRAVWINMLSKAMDPRNPDFHRDPSS